ncbi:MAG TPA: hypothetical protein PK400_04500 [Phycisphaerales bacterium]|nr:hypothetical protein [Phycisphaerales bacterium]
MPSTLLLSMLLVAFSPLAALNDDAASPARRPPTPTTPPASQATHNAQQPRVVASLLREGSHLLHAHGEVSRDESRLEWVVHVAGRDRTAPNHRLGIMPNTFLNEILQVMEASSGHLITFELTGKIFVYKGRNYIMLTHPPRVVGQRDSAAAQAAPKPEPQETPSEQPRRPASAADLMRELEREAGPVHRATPAPDIARTRPAAREQLQPEGTLLVQRRGRITRDAGGSWSFVLDADADGLADPPMTLLPCMLLQRIEVSAQRSNQALPVILSGQVTQFDGRNYLLPTLFVAPRNRTPITP